jgi:hypothetical protein
MQFARRHSFPARSRIFDAMYRASPNCQSNSERTDTLVAVCLSSTWNAVCVFLLTGCPNLRDGTSCKPVLSAKRAVAEKWIADDDLNHRA